MDGAFGLWAAASRHQRHQVAGVEAADSWTTDAHKWLNVPYDSGIVIVAHPAAHRAAMGQRAAYLIPAEGEQRDGMDWTLEASRRARVVPIYAVLRSLGRAGLEALVDQCCQIARRMAEQLRNAPGVTILNDVVLEQGAASLGSDERTDDVAVRGRTQGGARDPWLTQARTWRTVTMRFCRLQVSEAEAEAETRRAWTSHRAGLGEARSPGHGCWVFFPATG